jgi:anthranilate phosphoribosyltransferase
MGLLENVQPILRRLVDGQTLSLREAQICFDAVMAGRATDAQIGALLTLLTVRPSGPTVDEIAGAAMAMRAAATPVPVPAGFDVIDVVGTGGDGAATFNISTTAALIAAAAGARVAKHGNRAVTSSSGASQVLEALGVKLDVAAETQSQCLTEAGICFCFAPMHHPAMKRVIGPRKELGFRTIFNILGPLTNPAGAKRYLLGVFDPKLTEPIANVLGQLGATDAMVVHGSGLDEITTAGPTQVSELRNGKVTTTQISPEQFGIDPARIDDLVVDSPQASAEVVRGILEGKPGPARDIATLNAAAALVVAGLVESIDEGLTLARQSIDEGRAWAALDALARVTNA